EGVERLGRDDRDPIVGDPGLPPPSAGPVRPRPVGVDRDDRPLRRLAQREPEGRVAVGRPDFDDPRPPGCQRGEDAPAVAIDDRDPLRTCLGRVLDRGEHGGEGRRQRLDPFGLARPRQPAAVVLHRVRRAAIGSDEQPSGQTSSPAPKYRPAARMVPAAIVPTLMYSSPVADSIDRVRAVWTAARETTSGNNRPTIRRSQTNSAHGPTSTVNGPPPPGPAPVETQTANRRTWSATTASNPR